MITKISIDLKKDENIIRKYIFKRQICKKKTANFLENVIGTYLTCNKTIYLILCHIFW